jgi:hypothetical protein
LLLCRRRPLINPLPRKPPPGTLRKYPTPWLPSNAACIDKNFGAVLIIYDRLLGTFAAAPKDESMRFGLAAMAPSTNPFNIVFAAWLRMFSDMLRAKGVAAKLRTLFSRPA